MSLRTGALRWRLLPVALLAAACALASALAAAADAAPAPAAAPSAAPGQRPPPPALDEREDDAALDELLLPRPGRAARDNFLRFGKAGRDNFLRFGRAPRDNFLRFGKAGRDNFLRFGRAPRDNFLRFGKAGRDNFLRFGRANQDNFLRFGKAGRDNFLRFGKAGRDNFVRFGRAGAEVEAEAEEATPLRETRDRAASNFFRLGRPDPDAQVSLEEEALAARLAREDEDAEEEAEEGGQPPLERLLRIARDRNFLRFGRARPDNFVRFGRAHDGGDDGQAPATHLGQEEAAAAAAASAAAVAAEAQAQAQAEAEASTEGAQAEQAEEGAEEEDGAEEGAEERLGQRVGRAARPRSLFGRWKMADLNFIRLGRAAPPAPAPAEALLPPPAKRSGTPPRPGRSQVGRGDGYVDNFLRLGNGKRAKRSARAGPAPGPGPACAPRRPAALLGDLPLAPLTYYSPLAVGLPNYLLAPELGLLPAGAASAASASKRADRQGSNFIRLG